MPDTIFAKIIRKEIPAHIVYETETVLAFKDINPQAPVHILIIPKEPIPTLMDIQPNNHASLLADLYTAAQTIAQEMGLEKSGFRVVINNGADGGQEVYHLHLHLLGGRKLTWPPG